MNGLRYSTVATRIGEPDPFHEELGCWLWDAAAKQVSRCFIVPCGVTVIAGGTAEPDARTFELAAEVGSDTYGTRSNRFLDVEFKTVRYELEGRPPADVRRADAVRLPWKAGAATAAITSPPYPGVYDYGEIQVRWAGSV